MNRTALRVLVPTAVLSLGLMAAEGVVRAARVTGLDGSFHAPGGTLLESELADEDESPGDRGVALRHGPGGSGIRSDVTWMWRGFVSYLAEVALDAGDLVAFEDNRSVSRLERDLADEDERRS